MSTITTKPIEFFIPEYCVQGERIPFYMIWDKSQHIKVSISLSKGLKLQEVYNIDSKKLTKEENSIIAQDFEMEGYFGGVIKSQMYDEPSINKLVKFSISEDSQEIKYFEKSIELFRSDVKISNNIQSIIISHTKNKQITNKQIPLLNHGKGTGIIKISILEDSEITEGIPEGFEEFKVKFLEDINENFNELKIKFPQYKKSIENLMMFIDNQLPSESDKLNNLRTTAKELERAFNNNEEFYEEFAQGIATAYLKNMSILTDIIAFLAFMKSVGKNRIIFVDAMKVLKVSTEPQKLKARLIVTDLVRNEYTPIKLPEITLVADKECTIPIYQIFNTLEEKS